MPSVPAIVVTKHLGESESTDTLVNEDGVAIEQGLETRFKDLSLSLNSPSSNQTNFGAHDKHLLNVPVKPYDGNIKAAINNLEEGTAQNTLQVALNEIGDLDAILHDKQQHLQHLERISQNLSNVDDPVLNAKPSQLEQVQSICLDSTRLNSLVGNPESLDSLKPCVVPNKAFLTQPNEDLCIKEHSIKTPKERILVSKKRLIPFTPHNSSASLGGIQQLGTHDFIARNKALGPEARYYSALTPQEQERVNKILALDSDDDLNDVDADLKRNDAKSNTRSGELDTQLHSDLIETPVEATAQKKPETERTEAIGSSSISRHSNGSSKSAFIFEGEDAKRMEEIHRKLSELIPVEEWQSKLLSWSAPVSGWTSPKPSTALPSIDPPDTISIGSVSSTATNSSNTSTRADDARMLKKLEHELSKLKEDHYAPATKDEIEKVLIQCLRSEITKNQKSQV